VADQPDCSESLHELYTFLDGELTVERRVAIQAHLDGCSPCGERYDFEAELRLVVQHRCQEQVPETLKQRVFDALQQLDPGADTV
jgi:mycothiol system anti-sigma-R factor